MADKKKHRYLVAILCMALLCPYIMTVLAEGAGMLFASAAPIPVKGVCTANELNIRSGPGTNYEQVKVNGVGAYLTKNQEVEILSEKNAAMIWKKHKICMLSQMPSCNEYELKQSLSSSNSFAATIKELLSIG